MSVTSQSVSAVTDAAIPVLFDFLTVPANHVLMDGSGRLVSAGTTPITKVGDVFTVHMNFPPRGEYDVENHVVEFTPDVQLAWMPAGAGQPPIGVRWDWQFDVGEKGATLITQTCDWSRVTDERYLATYTLPRVSADDMRATIKRLIDLVGS